MNFDYYIDEHITKVKKGNDDKKIDIKDTIKAVDGTDYSSEKVFVAMLKHLQKESSAFLRKKRIRVKKNEIQWIARTLIF